MKKSKRILAGTGLIMSLSVLTSCSVTRPFTTVYGPPPDHYLTEATVSAADLTPTPVPAVTPADMPILETEIPAPVYGPPPFMKDQEPAVPEETGEVSESPEGPGPSEEDPEWPEDVYGPPDLDDWEMDDR